MTAARRPAKKPAAATKTPPLELVPSASARKAYPKLLEVIHSAQVDEARGFDERWEAIERVRAKHYYVLEDDTPTFVAWLKKHVGEAERTANRNLRVAAVASPAEIVRYTVSKINLALAIRDARERNAAKAKGVAYTAPERPAPIDIAALRFDVTREDKRRKVDLEAVTQNELEALLSELTGSKDRRERAARASLSPTAKRAAAALAESSMKNITVAEHDNELAFDGVRADQLRAFGRLLAKLTPDE